MSVRHDGERRRFLEVIGTAGVATAAVACSDGTAVGTDAGVAATDNGGVDTGPPVPMGFDAGPSSDYGSNLWRLFGAPTNLIVARDAMGLFAFTRVCTHERCNINASEAPTATMSTTGTFLCPCHMSRFDGNGAVTRGPASRPLQHFSVGVANGRVLVNTALAVAAGQRTPAP